MKKKNKKLWAPYVPFNAYSQYTKDYCMEKEKYIDKLNDEEKEWLNDFLLGYYYRNKKSFDKLGFTTQQRRDSYNRHRRVLNDAFNRSYTVGDSAEQIISEVEEKNVRD